MQFVWPLIHKEQRASHREEGLSPRAQSVCSHTQHTQTHLTHKPKSTAVNTDPCERLGFMELMGGCMGTFPGGSFCLFFWWRRRRRRPSSSHHEERRAGKRAEYISTIGDLLEITTEVPPYYCKHLRTKKAKHFWEKVHVKNPKSNGLTGKKCTKINMHCTLWHNCGAIFCARYLQNGTSKQYVTVQQH